jgi:L-threonylcarbamoyladenylate synthase
MSFDVEGCCVNSPCSMSLLDRRRNLMACPVGNDVAHAAGLLLRGCLVAFPTETVYGLGANALDTTAVARVFAAKDRPEFDPLIVHVADKSAARGLSTNWSTTAERLADQFWPGPLTLVVPKVIAIPDLVTSGMHSVAIRVPRHPLAQQLLATADVPVAAPSANLFGRISPTTAAHVLEQLGDEIDYILDGGPCQVGIESTVVSLLHETPSLLRPGGVCLEELERVLGSVPVHSVIDSQTSPVAPGQLLKHYAPQIPITVVANIAEFAGDPDERVGLLTPDSEEANSRFEVCEVLSTNGDLIECAAGFFAALSRLDAAEIDHIVAVRFPDVGLGRALNDRLARASAT